MLSYGLSITFRLLSLPVFMTLLLGLSVSLSAQLEDENSFSLLVVKGKTFHVSIPNSSFYTSCNILDKCLNSLVLSLHICELE